MSLFHLKKPVFDNVQMVLMNGEVVSHTNMSGANRYVEKGMAVWIAENSICVNFSPLFKNKEQQLYNTQKFENRCVCCGTDKELTKHHVFPNMFVRELKNKIDKDSKHDILLLCETCHEYYELRANTLKADILKKYQMFSDEKMKDLSLKQMENQKILAARSLMQRLNGGTSFESNGKIVTPPMQAIEEKRLLAQKELHPLNDEESPRRLGYQILSCALKQMSLQEFVQIWRSHFIKVLKPKFLPKHWNIGMPI